MTSKLTLASARELLRTVELTAWEIDPKAGAALGQLGAEAEVVLTDAADTARISRAGDRYRIEVSPRFVKNYVRSPYDLLFVILHEIRHKVQGDLLRPGGDDPVSRLVANIVADVRINGELCWDFFPEGVPLLDRLYAKLSVPTLLLLPPHRLLALFGPERGAPHARGCVTMADLLGAGTKPLRAVVAQTFLDAGVERDRIQGFVDWYLRAWMPNGSHDSLFNSLRRLLDENACLTFLGSHDTTGRGRGRSRRGRGAGRGDKVFEELLEPENPPDRLAQFRRQIRAALEPAGRAPMEDTSRLPDRGVYPTLGRRESYLLSAGAWPVFFPTPFTSQNEECGSVRVYMDVSGSTAMYQPLIYGIVRHLGALVREPVLLFSNVVEAISLEEVGRGIVRTTGGTDFDCVIEHALRERARKILIVTDAEGPLSPVNAAALERAGLEVSVLLTEESPQPFPILEVARNVWSLPGLEGVTDPEIPF